MVYGLAFSCLFLIMAFFANMANNGSLAGISSFLWVATIIGSVVYGIVHRINKGRSSHSFGSSRANTSAQNMWNKFEQSTMKTVNENWSAYLQRARQENQAGKVLAGDNSLDTLLHNFLWCVYDLGKFAIDCHGILNIQTDGKAYSIQASARLSIDESSHDRKYQVLYRAMTESFFINTPGIRLVFSDHKRDIDHEAAFPWVSKDHARMIPTTDYYVTGMDFSIANITSLNQNGLLSETLKTPKDILKYKANEHRKYGLDFTITDSRDGIIRMDYISHYTEPNVE